MKRPEYHYLWKDRKRILGMPLTFTRFFLTEDRLFVRKGLLNLVEEEVLLYRIRDLSYKQNLWQRIFGVGTVLVHSSDASTPHMDLINVKYADAVKEMVHQQVEKVKIDRRMRIGEILEDADCEEGQMPS